MRNPWVILSNRALRKLYHELQAGDAFIGRLAVKYGEEFIFLDLEARGVKAYPSLLAQHLARSKCFQAQVFSHFMLPHTRLIRDRHDLIKTANEYGSLGVKKVVLKQDRFNCGLGIHLFEHVEEVMNLASFGNLPYPFVLQPFAEEITDVRVIILGNYLEAYSRKNPYNFRNNLFFGGEAKPYKLNDEELSFCKKVMKRGDFPYAHIDLMILPDGRFYLSEINLRGGLKGAQITAKDYEAKVEELHRNFLQKYLEKNPQAKVWE
ncbi:ATP-grasp domain-containing protein [Thermodesulfatator indicus]